MKITKQARREAKALFAGCLREGRLQEDRVREVVNRVIELKPRGYLAILSHFQRLVRLEVNRYTARVQTAVPATAELQIQVRESLEKRYGAGLDIQFSQDEKLIGGLKVTVGSDVLDGSVQGRLAALSDSF